MPSTRANNCRPNSQLVRSPAGKPAGLLLFYISYSVENAHLRLISSSFRSAYAEKAGLKVETFAVPSTNEIASTVNVMTGKVDAIWVPIDNTIASAFSTVVSSNQTAKKPIYPSATAMVEAGGLASVVVDQHDLGVATGKMIAKVLKGEKPADTPVNVFSTGKSVINKKVAQELGITIPESVIKEAGQVIE